MQIGNYKLYSIETGTFGLDGGAMFGVVPKPLWQKTNEVDDANRVTLSGRCLLLVSDSKKILIDTGIGENYDDKFLSIYDVEFNTATLFGSLQKLNINPDEITDVILTHLHFDHTGGSVLFRDGNIIPAFPNAKYHVQQKQFDWAMSPSTKDKASFIKDRFEPLAKEGILNFFNGDSQFNDQIELLEINGHTFSQQMIKISDSSNTLLYCADLIPFASHVRLPYIMSYDLNPLITLQEKEKYLQKAVDENWMIMFEHDPKIIAATVKAGAKGIEINKKFSEI